jgi:hypothetical protein
MDLSVFAQMSQDFSGEPARRAEALGLASWKVVITDIRDDCGFLRNWRFVPRLCKNTNSQINLAMLRKMQVWLVRKLGQILM